MTKIKGQNLRLSVGSRNAEKCIAAAQSCSVHLAAQVGDVTSKDSDGAWTENEILSFSWDASVDALTADNTVASIQTPSDSDDLTEVPLASIEGATGSSAYYIQNGLSSITLRPNETITTQQHVQCPIAILKHLGNSEYEEIVYNDGLLPEMTYTNKTDSDMTIAYAFANAELIEDDDTIDITITDNDAVFLDTLKGYMASKTLLNVLFGVTVGTKNRSMDEMIATGTAYITDINITAANRQNSTYSCQLTGVGELNFSS